MAAMSTGSPLFPHDFEATAGIPWMRLANTIVSQRQDLVGLQVLQAIVGPLVPVHPVGPTYRPE